MELHALLSASKADRWLNCPGSINACKGLEEKTSPYAEEGTKAHEYAANFLLKNEDAKIPEDLDMQSYVQSYLDYVRKHITPESKLLVEQRVDYSEWVKDGFGTLDCAIIDKKHAHIIDLKYGQGKLVKAFDNNQLRIYALGLLSEYPKIKSFTLHIFQPRKFSFTTYELSVSELEMFGEWVRHRAILTEAEDAPRIPSEDACQWCLAKNDCPALLKHSQAIITQEFTTYKTPAVESLTDEQIVAIVKNEDLIIDFMKAVKDRLFEKVSYGDKSLGYKIVEAKTNRKWTDDAESKLVELVGEEKAYNKKIIGLTEATKLIGKDKVNEMTFKPKGAPTLALETDPREEVQQIGFD